MSIFDELRQKYNNLYYPSAGERQFQAVRNNLTKDILSNELDSARNEYKSLLSGTGFDSRSIDATRPGQAQQFSIDPITGQTVITTPEYMGGFRSDQTDYFPGGGYQTGFDTGESIIDPITGLPRDMVTDSVTDSTTGLVGQNIRTGGGRDENRTGQARSIATGYNPYSTFNMANTNPIAQTALGLIGAVTGIPTGLFSGITTGFAKQKLKNTYGINSNDIDSINKDIEDGMSVEEAMDKFRQTSEKHQVGRDLIGTGEIDPGFGLVSDNKLREITKKAEDDFDSFLDDYDKNVYADPEQEGGGGPTGPLGGQVGSGSQPQGPFGIGDKGKDKDKSGPTGPGGGIGGSQGDRFGSDRAGS